MKFALSIVCGALFLGGACASPSLAAKPAATAPAPSPIDPPSDMTVPSPDDKAEPAKPTACFSYRPVADSKAIGRWSLRQRDDGEDWAGPWEIEFKPDGSWTQAGQVSGYWCQKDDLFVFGFSDDPHTTYRGSLGVDAISGVESWNGGGTGVFEAKKNPSKKDKKKKK